MKSHSAILGAHKLFTLALSPECPTTFPDPETRAIFEGAHDALEWMLGRKAMPHLSAPGLKNEATFTGALEALCWVLGEPEGSRSFELNLANMRHMLNFYGALQ